MDVWAISMASAVASREAAVGSQHREYEQSGPGGFRQPVTTCGVERLRVRSDVRERLRKSTPVISTGLGCDRVAPFNDIGAQCDPPFPCRHQMIAKRRTRSRRLLAWLSSGPYRRPTYRHFSWVDTRGNSDRQVPTHGAFQCCGTIRDVVSVIRRRDTPHTAPSNICPRSEKGV